MKENNMIAWLEVSRREDWQKQLFVLMMDEYYTYLDEIVPGGCPKTFIRED